MRSRFDLARRCASSGNRIALKHVERRAIAEEVGLVVEQSFDDHLRQARLLAHDENGDEFVERRQCRAREAVRKALSRSASAGSW